MSPAPDRGGEKPPIVSLILFVLAAPLYAVVMSNLPLSQLATDAAGRGIASAYIAFFALLLFCAIAGMLLAAIVNGAMPVWARWLSPLLLVSGTAVAIMSEFEYEHTLGWSVLVRAALPPLFAAYVLWSRVTLTRRIASPQLASAVGFGLSLLVMIAGYPLAVLDRQTYPARAARMEAEARQLMETRERELAAAEVDAAERFHRLGPDSALGDYLEFLAPIGDSQDEAVIAGMRRVNSRQDDAVPLLWKGQIVRLNDLWRLDLTSTPELCAAFGEALGKLTAEFPEVTDYYLFEPALRRQLPNLHWLAQQDCDLGRSLAETEAKARRFGEELKNRSLLQLADELAGLQPHR